MGKGYIAYNLSPESKADLLRLFPPKFEKVVAHHATHQFGVDSSAALPERKPLKVVGYASDDKLECAVVEVGGSTNRPDGGTYHITLSLGAGASAKMSNELLKEKGWEPIESTLLLASDPVFNPF